MTVAEAKKLKEGQRVTWTDGCLGTIAEAGYAAVKIRWDDDQWALMPFHGKDVPWKNLRKAA